MKTALKIAKQVTHKNGRVTITTEPVNLHTTTDTPGHWYEASTGNHQGLIISEATGENIAVSYDKQHARLISAAPELLAALQAVIDYAENEAFALSAHKDSEETEAESVRAFAALALARAAIAKATGKSF